MKVRTSYDLEKAEVDRVELNARLISNRLTRPHHMWEGEMYEEPYGTCWKRRDMYWIECRLEDTNLGTLLVIPSRLNATEFTLVRNSNRVGEGYNELIERATKWFKSTIEYEIQCYLNKALIRLTEYDKLNGFTKARKVEK